jgi:hypothetical protein
LEHLLSFLTHQFVVNSPGLIARNDGGEADGVGFLEKHFKE